MHKVIYHPLSGLCVLRKSLFGPLKLGSCSESEAWSYGTQKVISLKGSLFCLQAQGSQKPARLGFICIDSDSKWDMISDSKMHLTSKASDGSDVCLDVDSNNNIVTNPCKCLSKDKTCDPASQWFKLVDSTKSSGEGNSIIKFNPISDLSVKDYLWKFLDMF